MRWTPGRRSRNIEDRRGERAGPRIRFPFPGGSRGGGRIRIPGGGGRARRAAPRLSLGGILLLLLIFFLMRNLGGTPGGSGSAGPGPGGTQIQVPRFPAGGGGGMPSPAPPPVGARVGGADAREEKLVDFVSFVLDDLQATWRRILPDYRDAKLVLFRDSVRSGCGFAAAQMGPFYCPVDEKVYIDLSFYEDLQRNLGAPGDFAQAYVLAHEVGHHVQKIIGVEPQVRRLQRANPGAANALSVAMELQADCFAGVWGHATNERGILERGDVEEGLNAAAQIGDDRMQRRGGGYVMPEAFTHGSSEQRARWLRRGLDTGNPNGCDTFSAEP